MNRLIIVVALSLYVWGWRKHGFRKASFWACVIVMSIYPFTLTGMLLPTVLGWFGIHQISMPVRIAAGAVAIIGAIIAAKYLGWGKVLAGAFQGALVVSSVVIVGWLFVLIMTVAAHSTGGH